MVWMMMNQAYVMTMILDVYEGLLMRPNNASCGEATFVCREYPNAEGWTVTRFLGVPENSDRTNFEYSVPDICIEPYIEPGYMFNGTWMQGNDLDCYGIKPISDFRVTIEDQQRHHFDRDYDGIGCEYND